MISISEPISVNPSEALSPEALPPSADDTYSFERVLEDYLPQVRVIVDRMKRRLPQTVEEDELYSIGVTGLIAAARNFSPTKAGSFASYASTRIRGAILDELRRSDW